jgi:multidrug efflux pump subunit AcrB
MSLQQAMDVIKSKVEPTLKETMPADGAIKFGGSADSLKRAIANMSDNFIIALGVLFLIMAALFRSAKESVLVILTVPLATVGGMISLNLLNKISFQPLDLLTMIGFVILLGLVVNNAILLVYETRRCEREKGMPRSKSVESALRQRLRPIFMSTLTTIVGMMPLILIPGEGSVIYRGLAVVIAGGMAFSTIFTIFMLPALLRFGEQSSEPQTVGVAQEPAAQTEP